ncbi:oxygenase MpaB family protein (plasmid) [Streptomyces sp. BI20]|uniref:oxygenase MpaB family protein n=1 Tax=Streptomyces sp. BI20 TaxID=3403460 RepID=UPI003C718EF1
MPSVGPHPYDTPLRATLGEHRIALVSWRLLVLQAAHPAVGAGMTAFSTYRGHPWRRIQHTMDSGRRLFFSDAEDLAREVERLRRTHRRIQGTDEKGRGFSAADPEVRTWVMVTLYEALTAMRALAGEPFTPTERDAVYAEFREVCAALGLPGELLPAEAADVPAYVDKVARETLEYGETVHHLLFEMLRTAPAPRRLGRLGPLWPLLRPLVSRLLTVLTVADLPPAARRAFRLRRTPGAAAVSWLVHHGARAAVDLLPARARYRAASSGAGPARRRPVPVPAPRRGEDPRRARLEDFFARVLDQTGDGRVGPVDLQAKAHTVCWNLELDDAREDELYAAFETWWQRLRADADADGDGTVDREEFVRAMLGGLDRDPGYLEEGLHVALRALFRAADTDGSGRLGPDEYRVVFGGKRVHPAELTEGFRTLDADGDGSVDEDEFLAGFTAYFTARAALDPTADLFGRS